MIAVEMLPHLEAEAKERQRASGGDRKSDESRERRSVVEKIPQPISHLENKEISGKARDEAAKLVGERST
jgi:hypothetical protein